MKQQLTLLVICLFLLVGACYWFYIQLQTIQPIVSIIIGTDNITPAVISPSPSPVPTNSALPETDGRTDAADSTTTNMYYVPLAIAIIAVVALFLLPHATNKTSKSTEQKQKSSGTHPATWQDAKAFLFSPGILSRLTDNPGHSHQNSNKLPRKLTLETRLELGKWGMHMLSLSQKQQENNTLLTGPAGSGKTSGIIIPNLLQELGNRSLFIYDPEGNLLQLTAKAVSNNHTVRVFAPMQPTISCGYNPLAYIENITDAQSLAQCWIKNTEHTYDETRFHALKTLITAVILHLKATEVDAAFKRIATLLRYTSYQELHTLLEYSPSQDAAVEIKTLPLHIQSDTTITDTLLDDAATCFQFLSDPEISATTKHNTINFTNMTETPTALYLSTSSLHAQRCRPLLACFVMHMFKTWEQQAAGTSRGRLHRPIACYLDKFATLGRLPHLLQTITKTRNIGISFLISLQRLDQLTPLYDQNTIHQLITNCSYHLLLAGAGREQNTYYATRINGTQMASTTQASGSEQLLLKTPPELLNIKEKQILLLVPSNALFTLTYTPYYDHNQLHNLAGQTWQPTYIGSKKTLTSDTQQFKSGLSNKENDHDIEQGKNDMQQTR